MTEPCDLSAVAARRLIGTGKSSPPPNCSKAASSASRRPTARSTPSSRWMSRRRAKRAGPPRTPMRKGDELGAARRPAGRRQGSAGDRRPAHDVGLAAVQGPRADRGRAERRQRAQGRRRHPRQDQHAGVRRRRQYHQSRLRRRPAIRSIPTKTLRRAPPAARPSRWRSAWCRSRPAPTTAAACARRPRSAAWSASGRRRALVPNVDRAASLVAVRRHRADGPHGRGRAPAAARAARPATSAILLLQRQRAHPGAADRRRSRRACASPSRPISAARRSTRPSPQIFQSRVKAFGSAFREVAGARARLRAMCTSVRDPPRRRTSSPPTASGWRSRASCSTATSSTTPSAA